MGLFSFLSKGEKTMKMTTLEQDVKKLKEENEELKKKKIRQRRTVYRKNHNAIRSIDGFC